MIAKIVGNLALVVCVSFLGLALLLGTFTALGADYFLFAIGRIPLMMG